MTRHVCHFSCGAASAVATKLTIADHGPDNVVIVNAFVKEEHEDNRRFLAECEQWFGILITVVRNDKFNASTHEVWRKRQYIKGPNGAPCSQELKRKLLAELAQPGDINVLGFTSEEIDRFEDYRDRNPDKVIASPLIERNLSKSDCLAMIDRAGIELPLMYRLGYDNANCVGCPKGGTNYWQAIREDFPEDFAAIRAIQESIGPGAYFLRFRSGPRKGERMALSELPSGRGSMRGEPSFSCSFFCDMAEQDIADK